MRTVAMIVALLAVLLAAGCRSGSGPHAFTYTAVPYTVVQSGSATPAYIADGPNGGTYYANEVMAIVRRDQK